MPREERRSSVLRIIIVMSLPVTVWSFSSACIKLRSCGQHELVCPRGMRTSSGSIQVNESCIRALIWVHDCVRAIIVWCIHACWVEAEVSRCTAFSYPPSLVKWTLFVCFATRRDSAGDRDSERQHCRDWNVREPKFPWAHQKVRNGFVTLLPFVLSCDWSSYSRDDAWSPLLLRFTLHTPELTDLLSGCVAALCFCPASLCPKNINNGRS